MKMTRNYLKTFLLTLMVLSVPVLAELPPGEYMFVAFGDSTTATRSTIDNVYADNLRNELPLAGITGSVINSGVGGMHTGTRADNSRFNMDHALERYPTTVLAHNPDVIIMQFGINDSWLDSGIASVTGGVITGDLSRIPYDSTDPRNPNYPNNYEANLTFMVQQFKAHSSNPIIVLMTSNQLGYTRDQWRNDVLEVYAQRMRDVAAAENTLLVDVWQMYADYDAVSGQSKDDLLLDGVHPNDTGHRMVADAIYDVLGVTIPDAPPLTESRAYTDFDFIYEFEAPHDQVPDSLEKYPLSGTSDFASNRLDAGGYNTPVGAASVSGGILTLDTGSTTMGGSSSGGRWYSAYDAGEVWRESGLSYTAGYTIEIRAKVIAGEELGDKSINLMTAPDSTSSRAVLTLSESQTQFAGLTVDTTSNTDQFHTYRVVQTPGFDAFYVFREDSSGDMAEAFSGVAGSGSGPYFNIGDGSSSFGGKVEIDYIAFTPGAYAPVGVIPCDTFLAGDLNEDCYVNLLDLILLVNNWLECTDPADPVNCQ
jgi:lysophospholipase L1-like esterase